MTDVHGLIPHQPGYHYITLEEDYVLMFQLSANARFEQNEKTDENKKERDQRYKHAVAKAYISSVLEQLSDKQFKDGVTENNIWVFLSFPEIESRIHGGCKQRTLKDAMKEMIDDGYVTKRPNPDPRFRSLVYHMNLRKYRVELNALPKRDNDAKMHDSFKGTDDNAELHDDSANLHDGDANLHEHNAETHDTSCKNAPKNNSRLTTEETGINTEESTYPQPESQLDDSGSSEPTHTYSSSQDDINEKGHDDAQPSGTQDRRPASLPAHRVDSGAHSERGAAGEQAPSTQTPNARVRSHAPAAPRDATSERVTPVETHSQLSTLPQSSPQQSAKVAPRPPAFVAAPLFAAQKPARPQLTEEGKNVFEWFQTIQACKMRKTNENINAANGLAEEDGMNFENLKAVIEHWQADTWVKKNQIPIDLQTLEDPKGRLTFAKAMLVIRPNKPKPTNERKTALLSCAHMTDEEYNAYIRGGTR